MVVEKRTTISDLKSRINWQDNVLSTVDNYNYYIKLFITSVETHNRYMREGMSALNNDNAEIFTIAETATTAFNLDNLEITGYVSPNEISRFSTATNFTFTIREQGGLSLIDRIILAAKQLGIPNWVRLPYFLQIEFKGYNEDGTSSKIIENTLEYSTWIFRIVITDIRVSLDAGGSTYNVTAVTYDELGFVDFHQAIANNVTLTGSTIGEIVEKFIEERNKQEINQYGEKRNKYSVKFFPFPNTFGKIIGYNNLDMSNWRITGNPYKDQIKKESTTIIENKEITIPKGTNLQDLIKELYVNTREGQSILMRTKTNSEVPSDEVEETAYPWVEVKTLIRDDISYDHLYNDYNRDILYIIVPQVNNMGILTKKQLTPVERADKTIMKERVRNILDSLRLRKKYEYVFTGLNTEVLDFNLQFDNLYKATLPLYDGKQNFNNSTTTVVEQPDNIMSSTPPNSSFTKLTPAKIAKIRETFDVMRRTKKDPDQRGSLKIKSPDQLKNLNVPSTTDLTSISTNTRLRKQGKRLFIEDISLTDVENIDLSLPISVDKSTRYDPTTHEKLVETVNPNRKSFSVALLEQISSRNLIEIDLTIRGDPYWLGIPRDLPVTERFLEEWFQLNSSGNKSLAQYATGTENFLLVFKVPSGVDDNGNIILKANNIFNGIYSVVEVKHSFSRGEFKQTLRGRRNTLIDINFILDEIEAEKNAQEFFLNLNTTIPPTTGFE